MRGFAPVPHDAGWGRWSMLVRRAGPGYSRWEIREGPSFSGPTWVVESFPYRHGAYTAPPPSGAGADGESAFPIRFRLPINHGIVTGAELGLTSLSLK